MRKMFLNARPNPTTREVVYLQGGKYTHDVHRGKKSLYAPKDRDF
jgi:hypothetical protein